MRNWNYKAQLEFDLAYRYTAYRYTHNYDYGLCLLHTDLVPFSVKIAMWDSNDRHICDGGVPRIGAVLPMRSGKRGDNNDRHICDGGVPRIGAVLPMRSGERAGASKRRGYHSDLLAEAIKKRERGRG